MRARVALSTFGFAIGLALFAAALASPRTVPARSRHAGVRNGGAFRVSLPGIDYVDPALEFDPQDIAVIGPTCTYLMGYLDKPAPQGLRVVPQAAAGYPKVSRDGKTYTFTIRPGERFNTGAPLTAASFKHAIERILTPAMQSPLAPYATDIAGAQAMLDGKAPVATGLRAQGRRLVIRLVKRVPDLPARMTLFCAVPPNLPADPEGAGAPLPSPAPYYVSQYARGRQVVLERNRFYHGHRPHHVDRFVVQLDADAGAILDQVQRGDADWGFVLNASYGVRAGELVRKYGLNKARFFIVPGLFLRGFALNTSRPLLAGNVKLRQAINFAVDRKALLRARGGAYAGYLTDQYLEPSMPGFRNENIYPLERPDFRRAAQLARGHLRGRHVVLYTCNRGPCIPQAQIVQSNLARIGLDVEIKPFPPALLFEKLQTRGEPFDIGWYGVVPAYLDPYELMNILFDGRLIQARENTNVSYFDSPVYNRLLEQASQLSGRARYRAYGKLDVRLARDAAPFVAFAVDTQPTLVSSRVGCIVLNPALDLTAACLE